MEYLGYRTNVKFDEEADIFHGEVTNARGVITFQGKSVDEMHGALRRLGRRISEVLCRERSRPRKALLGQNLPPRLALHSQCSALSSCQQGNESKCLIAQTVEKAAQS